MRQRVVSSRRPVKAHPNHTYKFLEDLGNHRRILPGARNWSGDRDTARYSLLLGPFPIRAETRIAERIAGMRVREEPVSGFPFPYQRWFKIQADEHTSIIEISMECEMTLVQKLIFTPLLRIQLEGILKRIQAVMEEPKEAPKEAPSPASAAPAEP